MNWITKSVVGHEWRWWVGLDSVQKARHIVRVILAALMVFWGASLFRAPDTGTLHLIRQGFFMGAEVYALWMFLSGLHLFALKFPNWMQFFVLTLPIAVWFSFSFQGALRGLIGWQGFAVTLALYLILLVLYYGYRDTHGMGHPADAT